MELNIRNNYTTPKASASFSSVEPIYRSLNQDKSISRAVIKSSIEKENAYSLHKRRVHNFKRDRVYVNGIDDTWQVDLIDMQKYAHQNEGYRYILTIIDVFSKKAWAIPLKNKTGQKTFEAFESVFLEGRKPKRIQSDAGTEFKNRIVLDLFKKLEIKYYTTHSELKASVIERFNRTIKEKISRMFTANDNKLYLPYLKDLIYSYNNTFHRSIKTTPNSVNASNEQSIWKTLYGFDKIDGVRKEIADIRFNIGDFVRISTYKKIFDKGYLKNWANEVFIVNKVFANIPPLYYLVDLFNEPVFGSFYGQELQKISFIPSGAKIVDKILDHRIIAEKNQYLVSWVGQRESNNCWIEP